MMKKFPRIVVYIDGASRGNPGPSACAVAIFDKNRTLIHEEGSYLGKSTNNFAEYSALHLALALSRRFGSENIEIFSDSELLVKQFSGEYKIKDAKLLELMMKIKKESLKFKKLKLCYIPRKQNVYTDKLVNKILNNAKMTNVLDKNIEKEKKTRFYQPNLF
ncbi:MAG: ribonuclease HI family protein [Elusimicrobia bacterium]|nr:ribonuclease HI family protein [Elusimicrobiota bacterium]